MHRRLTIRDMVIFGLILISISSSFATFFAYQRSQAAVVAADDALHRARALRKLTDYKLCQAINRVTGINNRDRETFLHSRDETRRALRDVADPVLHALLVRSLKQVEAELRIRPKIDLVPCVAVIEHPTGKIPAPPNP